MVSGKGLGIQRSLGSILGTEKGGRRRGRERGGEGKGGRGEEQRIGDVCD